MSKLVFKLGSVTAIWGCFCNQCCLCYSTYLIWLPRYWTRVVELVGKQYNLQPLVALVTLALMFDNWELISGWLILASQFSWPTTLLMADCSLSVAFLLGIIDLLSCDRYWLHTFSVYVSVNCNGKIIILL